MKQNRAGNVLRYPTEKELDCEYCAHWQSETEGCALGGPSCCPYIVREEKPAAPSRCEGCPYGMASPCIGWCTVDVMKTVFKKRTSEEGVQNGSEKAGRRNTIR